MANKQLYSEVNFNLYNRDNLPQNIVHIGLGAFHRGHQAFIFNQLNQISDEKKWGICAINLFDDGTNIVGKLKQQNRLFNVIERSTDSDKVTTVGSIINAIQLQDVGIDAVIDKLAEPQVEIVTFTVTEKGYCTTAGGKALDLQNPIIKEDLVNLDNPKSVPAILYKALKLRFTLNRPPITLLSCDNMPENGHALKNALFGFINEVDPEFIEYVEKSVSFPCSMVDRIVPAVSEESLSIAENIIGEKDSCAILTEPFIQWVVEDNFALKRPNIDKVAGVSVAKNVIPFEEMKLRMLNGSHSFLAYLGSLAGYTYISDCMKDPEYRKATYTLMMKEQAPTLTVEGVNLEDYANELIARFENTSLKHQTQQIAMDGSQKIPQRFLASMQQLNSEGKNFSLLSLGLAGWMKYVSENIANLKDPLKEKLEQVVKSTEDNEERVKEFLNLTEIFPADFITQKNIADSLIKSYLLIKEKSTKEAVDITINLYKF